MNDFQFRNYLLTVNKTPKKKYNNIDPFEMQNSFYIKSRMVSNIAFPEQKENKEGYELLVDELRI
jgi:hypothetical protein